MLSLRFTTALGVLDNKGGNFIKFLLNDWSYLSSPS